ncbi:MFS transporter [Paraburkholderia susongensis]|uniref:MFS transporter, AAHS family, 4-hydroxybenzoate transporter n=1 Tax=Paraburkholderia susongensis TaxID=1515439 RepID=A0A1X7LQU5_9BURK|nr:aromatic acid/H+ symport family MFS transporter [Paraburkholderia susongensis]SMG56040.1 MFS transporter, AAHS family, 4-hydroxybenzoate transporter [Paraburkholderia susongensis]
MTFSKQLNVQEFLDSRPFCAFHWKILLLGLAVLILDGFDVVAMGFIAPALIGDWKITRAALGPVLSMGLFGLAIGALAGGPLADRFGRRRVIIGAVVFFGLMSIASAWSPNIAVLSVMRFLTGLGLGASQPNAATLASEYAPKKHRSLMVTVIYCGFTLGAAGGGFLSSYLIPLHGWQSILVVGGVVPLVFAVALFFVLPESAKFLAVKHEGRAALARIINQIEPAAVDASTELVTAERGHAGKGAIRLIVSKPHTTITLALWVGLFMNLMTVYFLNSWLPIIVKDNNFSLADAALVGAMMQVGGTLGNIVIGWKMDRFKAYKVMIGMLLGAGIFTVLLAQLNVGLYGLIGLVFLLGYCINSTNTGWTAMAANYYPTEMRATGTSWMTGIGRFGAISGASIGAVLLSFKWDFGQLFLALTVPIGIAIVAAYVQGRRCTNVAPVLCNATTH